MRRLMRRVVVVVVVVVTLSFQYMVAKFLYPKMRHETQSAKLPERKLVTLS